MTNESTAMTQQEIFQRLKKNGKDNEAKGESDSQYGKGLHRLRNRFAIHSICQTGS